MVFGLGNKRKQESPRNDVPLSHCNPIVVNQTEHPIVVFLDRGVLYNKQVLYPGEAVAMPRTNSATGGSVVPVPYKIHAVIGDEQSLPTRRQSLTNALSTAVIPTAFIIGTFMAAGTAGTSTALSRAAGGVVVRGMVIDSAALAAGSLSANRAAMIADKLIEKKPENFAIKSGTYMPGNRFVLIEGGIDSPLKMVCLRGGEKQFRQTVGLTQDQIKMPMDTLSDKMEYYTPSLFKSITSSLTKKGSGQQQQPQLVEEQEQEQQQDGSLPRGAGSGGGGGHQEAPPSEEQAPLERPPPTNPESSFTTANTASATTPHEGAVEAPPQFETEEDRQYRLAIAESLKEMEQEQKQRKQEEEELNKLVEKHQNNCNCLCA